MLNIPQNTPVTPSICEMCGKVKYETEKEAMAEAKYKEEKYGEQWPYQSFNCGSWHLTSAPPE